MKFLVVVEEGPESFGAYVPDLPGCVAVGATRAEVIVLIQEAIEFHLEGIRADGQPLPQPNSSAASVEVEVAQ
ncbi:hypothetical protein Jab_1c16880 [Janthinobacterium sp. HH01]|uniref:type II toxin-antitoxin system HicB family antitoxin n=1 Tax=Janthinobacterium sp. HH01 TaxID=1198452 RepID=UPI0002AE9D41|nr:type II toxin-antitoxin system HicB family antitoxin [Janthinobacterium sp. HH01]ELX13068.1 hypothetical protein Jab_1c16880 [Janthinobacterium sp. HH01]